MHRLLNGLTVVEASRDGVRPPLLRPAPILGQHTAEVLANLWDLPAPTTFQRG